MIITIKSNTPVITLPFQQEYSAVFRFAYKRAQEELKQKDIRALVKSKWPKLGSWLAQCAILDALAQYDAHKARKQPVIWGGRDNFKKLSRGKIAINEWKQLRLRPMNIQGEVPQKSNRLFDFSKLADNIIIFKPNKTTKIEIPVNFGRNRTAVIDYLIRNIGKIPISVQLKSRQISLSFKQERITTNVIPNRIMGIDQNPNYLGITIVDFVDGKEKLIKSIVYKLNKSTTTNDNKRDHETKELAHEIMRIAKHYKVAKIGIEQLTMGAQNTKKGRNFNRLVNNQWNRTLFNWIITKLCDRFGIELAEVNCAYSSTIGNLLHNLPDPAAASWEIARRAYHQYKKSLCMYPPLDMTKINHLNQWKNEGFEFGQITSWVELHNSIKNAKLKYRSQLSSFKCAVSDFFSRQSGILVYTNFTCLY